MIYISGEKTKLTTNNINRISNNITIGSETLEEVNSFKYLGSIISDEGSKKEILSRIAQTTAAMVKLKPIWNDRQIRFCTKIRLMRSLAMSIFLYACETWTLTAELQRRILALEMRCYRKIMNISYIDHITNNAIRERVTQAIGTHDDLLTVVKKRKLKWYGPQLSVKWYVKNNIARHYKRKKKTKKAEKEMGR